MRFFPAILACLSLLVGSSASADSRVFIISNQADGYGVDQCLARGDKCGAHAAHSYCKSRNFAEATAYRRVESRRYRLRVDEDGEALAREARCDGLFR